jgi:alpha-beta hydrolase superfamily lysophospholipase
MSDGDAGSIPDWFWAAIETPREEGVVEVDECDVRWQSWAAPEGAPALLLVHGMFAHAHWWDFIAPLLADRYRIVALDLTGMGDSDYRYDYAADTFADELKASCSSTQGCAAPMTTARPAP